MTFHPPKSVVLLAVAPVAVFMLAVISEVVSGSRTPPAIFSPPPLLPKSAVPQSALVSN
jgi:hypothetical protein